MGLNRVVIYEYLLKEFNRETFFGNNVLEMWFKINIFGDINFFWWVKLFTTPTAFHQHLPHCDKNNNIDQQQPRQQQQRNSLPRNSQQQQQQNPQQQQTQQSTFFIPLDDKTKRKAPEKPPPPKRNPKQNFFTSLDWQNTGQQPPTTSTTTTRAATTTATDATAFKNAENSKVDVDRNRVLDDSGYNQFDNDGDEDLEKVAAKGLLVGMHVKRNEIGIFCNCNSIIL